MLKTKAKASADRNSLILKGGISKSWKEMREAVPPRCTKHQTAMIASRLTSHGWVELRCCLQGCSEKATLGVETYVDIYKAPPPKKGLED
jgi:hypothetical protein